MVAPPANSRKMAGGSATPVAAIDPVRVDLV